MTGTQSVIAAIKAKLESEPPAGGDAYHPLYTMSQIEQAAQIALGVTPTGDPEPVAWMQIGVGPLHEGERIPRLTKPKEWNPEWWRFEPLFT